MTAINTNTISPYPFSHNFHIQNKKQNFLYFYSFEEEENTVDLNQYITQSSHKPQGTSCYMLAVAVAHSHIKCAGWCVMRQYLWIENAMRTLHSFGSFNKYPLFFFFHCIVLYLDQNGSINIYVPSISLKKKELMTRTNSKLCRMGNTQKLGQNRALRL